jgi:hypothetical protein
MRCFWIGALCFLGMSWTNAGSHRHECCHCRGSCGIYYIKICWDRTCYVCMRDVDDFEKEDNQRFFTQKRCLDAEPFPTKEHICSECGEWTRNGYVKLCNSAGKRYFCWYDLCQNVLSGEIQRSLRCFLTQNNP